MENVHDWLALALAPGAFQRLLRKHQLVVGHSYLNPLENLPAFWRRQLGNADPAVIRLTEQWLEEDDSHQIVTRACADYPEMLAATERPPWILFIKGRRELLCQPSIALVGSRRASPYAIEQTEQLSKKLAQAGWSICSGMAMGIDGAAHRAALDCGGSTLAVLGSGVDICYPPRQRELYQRLGREGLLVSQFLPGQTVRRDHFLRRNRVISALSHATIVLEASLRSGSLSTARYALEYNRLVGALPGPVTQTGFAGNHRLLQQGALLVTSADDILAELPPLMKAPVEVSAVRPDIKANVKDNGLSQVSDLANAQMLANVGFETTSIDSLVARTGLPVARVMNQLISLELDGWVTAVPGGYVRVRRE